MKALHVKRNFVSEPSASPTNRVGPAMGLTLNDLSIACQRCYRVIVAANRGK